jgi:hypothetical protein
VADVEECTDCLVALVDERPLAPDEVGDPGEDQLAYELEDYDGDARILLDGKLTTAGIVHAWQGATLVVKAADEVAVDALVDELVSDAEEPEPLDPDAEQVVYELGDWSDDRRQLLVDALDAENIAYEWDEHGDLAVLEADEDRVEAMLDAIEYPEAIPLPDEGDDIDGDGIGDGGQDDTAVQEVLGELFVAADRLMHDAEDHEGVLAMVAIARQAESLPLPYGFSPPVWADIVEQAGAIRVLLEQDEEDDEVIMEQARTLRNVLRQYV